MDELTIWTNLDKMKQVLGAEERFAEIIQQVTEQLPDKRELTDHEIDILVYATVATDYWWMKNFGGNKK